MVSTPYALEGRCLTHTFGRGGTRATVLRDVNIGLHAGEIVLVMGPSGSGKSTLLAALAGLMLPTEGQALALGQDLGRMSHRARKRFRQEHFGFIFQGCNLFPALTAVQQLELVLRWARGIPAAEAKRVSLEMLHLLGLGHRVSLRPAQLSGGEKQRVAIGRALVKQPDFCFADEPTSALDWEHGKQVMELLRAAAVRRRTTVFMVSHDARLIPFVDRVCHLEDGRMSSPELALKAAEVTHG